MFTLLNEIHFWTTQNVNSIKQTDYGVYKYNDHTKDDDESSNTNEVKFAKRNYTEKRGYLYQVTNKRPYKLKDKLKDFEELLTQYKIIYHKWTDVSNILQIMLNNGIFIYINVNIFTGDIIKLSFDKFLVGKLLTNCVSDVIKTRSHLLCTYNDNRITLINFNKKPATSENFVSKKLIQLEPRIQVCELAGPTGRRLERKISCNATSDRVLVWWKSSTDEVYPWSPSVKDQDRANVHIYTLYGSKLELICYKKTEFDLLEIKFDMKQFNLIHCVEQKINRRGTVTVEVVTLEIIRNKLHNNLITSIPLQTHVSCHSFSPDDGTKLVLGCIDGSVVLFDGSRGVTSIVKAAFIPTFCIWHPSNSIISIANERTQIQFFDESLSCIKCQTITEDVIPSNYLDLTSYFKSQSTLINLSWNNNIYLNDYSSNNKIFKTKKKFTSNRGDSLLLLIYEHGPIAVLRLFDFGNDLFNVDVLAIQYIKFGYVEKSINILLSLDWNKNPQQCLAILQYIINHLLRVKFTPNIETQIQKALGSFYVPLKPISNMVKSDFGDQVADLTRKFFHVLVRYKLYEKAFCLGIDVCDYDLFMDLYYLAQKINNHEMEVAAYNRANLLIDRENSSTDHSSSSSSTCSRSSCSQCSTDLDFDNQSDNDTASNNNQFENHEENMTIPPLPNIYGNISSSSSSSSNSSHSSNSGISTNNSNIIAVIPPPLPTVQLQINNNNNKIFIPHKATTSTSTITTCTSSTLYPTFTSGMKFSTVSKHSHQNLKEIPKCLPVVKKTNFLETFENNHPNLNYFISSSNHANTFSLPKLYSTSSPSVIVHKTVSFNIPPASSVSSISTAPLKVNVPLNMSIRNSNNNNCGSNNNNTTNIINSNANTSNEKGEKNVKFSDTVTAFIVPEISRTDKPKRSLNPASITNNPFLTNPKQELQDSLPLCHPEDEYLKDFTPISSRSHEEVNVDTNESTTTIKVVHFGMV